MTKIFSTLLLILLCLTISAVAADGVQCRLTITQYDAGLQDDVLLYEDSAVFAKGVPASGLIGPFSLEVLLNEIDTVGVQFNAHVVTLGPPVKTYSRSFRMEYSLPARISGIEGKNDTRYSLIITPLKQVATSENCSFSHRAEKTFSMLPSAFMDIYYAPSTLADFHAQSVRGYLDYSYRRFQEFAGFNLPGKTLVYICPCQINSVIWDNRFGMSVDPTRSAAFAIYDKGINTADPFLVVYAALLRNYGYAPPFVAEGLAGYFSFFAPEMKRLLAADETLSIEPFLNTNYYLTADPVAADRTSASFIRYLVDAYGLDRLKELYRVSDDLNLRQKLEEVYGKPVSDLESEWKNYVDTLTIPVQDYYDFANLADQMIKYDLMVEYAGSMLDVARDNRDSTRAIKLLGRAYFFTGDYYHAVEMQDLMIKTDTGRTTEWMARGSYRMMNGDYGLAFDDYRKALEIEPDNQMVNFNLALYYISQNDDSTAKNILIGNIGGDKQAQAQGETAIMLANILSKSTDEVDLTAAARYYEQASTLFERSLSLNRASSSHYMWLGIARLGLDDINYAIENLRIADFLETRPFYSGMINLWLGKAFLRAGDKQAAADHFAMVLGLASADYHQSEARKYLEQL